MLLKIVRATDPTGAQQPKTDETALALRCRQTRQKSLKQDKWPAITKALTSPEHNALGSSERRQTADIQNAAGNAMATPTTPPHQRTRASALHPHGRYTWGVDEIPWQPCVRCLHRSCPRPRRAPFGAAPVPVAACPPQPGSVSPSGAPATPHTSTCAAAGPT